MIPQPAKQIYVKEVTGCYYSYERSCVLEAGIDKQRNLHIINSELLTFTTVVEIGKLLKEKFKYGDLYTNRHPALRYAYGYNITEIDFENDHKGDYQAINDTFNSLKSEGKIITDLDIKKVHVRNALDLVIIALLRELSGYNPIGWIFQY